MLEVGQLSGCSSHGTKLRELRHQIRQPGVREISSFADHAAFDMSVIGCKVLKQHSAYGLPNFTRDQLLLQAYGRLTALED